MKKLFMRLICLCAILTVVDIFANERDSAQWSSDAVINSLIPYFKEESRRDDPELGYYFLFVNHKYLDGTIALSAPIERSSKLSALITSDEVYIKNKLKKRFGEQYKNYTFDTQLAYTNNQNYIYVVQVPSAFKYVGAPFMKDLDLDWFDMVVGEPVAIKFKDFFTMTIKNDKDPVRLEVTAGGKDYTFFKPLAMPFFDPNVKAALAKAVNFDLSGVSAQPETTPAPTEPQATGGGVLQTITDWWTKKDEPKPTPAPEPTPTPQPTVVPAPTVIPSQQPTAAPVPTATSTTSSIARNLADFSQAKAVYSLVPYYDINGETFIILGSYLYQGQGDEEYSGVLDVTANTEAEGLQNLKKALNLLNIPNLDSETIQFVFKGTGKTNNNLYVIKVSQNQLSSFMDVSNKGYPAGFFGAASIKLQDFVTAFKSANETQNPLQINRYQLKFLDNFFLGFFEDGGKALDLLEDTITKGLQVTPQPTVIPSQQPTPVVTPVVTGPISINSALEGLRGALGDLAYELEQKK